MKFELKTENDNFSKSVSYVLGIAFFFTLLIHLFDFALKLGIISRYYQVEYNCRLLAVEKNSTNFKKLSSITNLKSKQRIWDFCREVVK
tara:strand:- start:140 stop:406 length:267 start_codon:yes stop_codon:yes gene_type:complete